MERDIVDRILRNGRYNALRMAGASRPVAKRGMDFSLENYLHLLDSLRVRRGNYGNSNV